MEPQNLDQVAEQQKDADGQDTPPAGRAWHVHLKQHWRRLLLGAGIAACTLVLITFSVGRGSTRRKRHGRSPSTRQADSEDSGQAVHIPLKEVVRFKERQWFLEDIELSREGDSNAMLRIAKMYLHGQGCKQSLPMAQEWLRKARQLGLYATVDELWGGEPEGLEQLRRDTVRQAERRRASVMQQAAGITPGYRGSSVDKATG